MIFPRVPRFSEENNTYLIDCRGDATMVEKVALIANWVVVLPLLVDRKGPPLLCLRPLLRLFALSRPWPFVRRVNYGRR